LNKISENIKEAENNLEEFKIILDQLQSLTNHLKERKQGERSFIINNLDNIDTNFNELKNYLNRFKKALGFRL
jgi:CHASE3 domain sensor protein